MLDDELDIGSGHVDVVRERLAHHEVEHLAIPPRLRAADARPDQLVDICEISIGGLRGHMRLRRHGFEGQLPERLRPRKDVPDRLDQAFDRVPGT
jgi:hypothetical protein